METRGNVGVNLVKIAAIYMMAGLFGGIVMAVSKDHLLASVHSHIALLGWTTMAITGLVYSVKPACAQSRLSSLHFWLHKGLSEVYELALLDEAVEPLVPVLPRRALDLILGAILGLALGAGLAILVEYLQTSQDVSHAKVGQRPA